jgi:4,5-dihydroxyphthalate decarboxylase
MAAAGAELELGFPIMRYDVTMPLLEGRVEIPGVKLRPTSTMSMVFNDLPPLRTGDFGLWDLNLGYLLPAIEAGWELLALPVFCKRKPASQFIFCRAGIDSPKDLEGKRIGSGSFRTALTVWCRGFLQHRHGVDVDTLRWVVWRPEHLPLGDSPTSVEAVSDPKKSVVDALLDGEVDALITDISDVDLFRQLETNPKVHRLFPDYEAEDERLFRDTGIYTPVHLVVMSKKLDREHPELSRRLYDAFVEAKRLAEWDVLSDRGGLSMPYLRERVLEANARWGDLFKYGIAANKVTLDTFMDFNVEQGMIGQPLPLDQVFARGTLDT